MKKTQISSGRIRKFDLQKEPNFRLAQLIITSNSLNIQYSKEHFPIRAHFHLR